LTFNEYLVGLKGKSITVIGAGISNTPLIKALLAADIDTTVRDKRSHGELGDVAIHFEGLGAKIVLGENYLQDLSADVIFRTPGLMPTSPALVDAVKGGAILTSEMEVFFDVCPCSIIAVTGSDGKTTTTSIIAQLLRNEGKTAHVGGNIGAPLLCRADDMAPNHIVVLELSSFQLITMKKCPNTAVVTNLAPNHLDVHKDMDEYVEAKRNIFLAQGSSDRVVLNLDNEYTRAYASLAPGEVLFFSRRESVRDGIYENDATIYEATGGHSKAIMTADDILLPGAHNVENFMAAFAAVRGIVSYGAMLQTAKTFRGVPHRIEFVRELRGVRFYNDSIASSPTRTIAGLRAFDEKVILIAGGKGKGIAFDELGSEIASRVKALILTGQTAEQIQNAVANAPGYAGKPEIFICDAFADAVHKAAAMAQDGDVVLLSPACTSFDRFRNFEERGDIYKEIVRGLK